MKKEVLEAELQNLVTIEDLVEIFDVTRVTIWRRGKELEAHRIVIPGRQQDSIRYRLSGVLRTAAKMGWDPVNLKQWRAAHPGAVNDAAQ